MNLGAVSSHVPKAEKDLFQNFVPLSLRYGYVTSK